MSTLAICTIAALAFTAGWLRMRLDQAHESLLLTRNLSRRYRAQANGYEAAAAVWEQRYQDAPRKGITDTTGDADGKADTAASLEAIARLEALVECGVCCYIDCPTCYPRTEAVR